MLAEGTRVITAGWFLRKKNVRLSPNRHTSIDLACESPQFFRNNDESLGGLPDASTGQ
jgi:hypothetical protein